MEIWNILIAQQIHLSSYLDIHFNVAYIICHCSGFVSSTSNQQTTLPIIFTQSICKVILTGINLQNTYPCYHSPLLVTITCSQSHTLLSNGPSKDSLQLSSLWHYWESMSVWCLLCDCLTYYPFFIFFLIILSDCLTIMGFFFFFNYPNQKSQSALASSCLHP